MNELTFVVALLVRKDILTVDEAKSLLKASREGTVNGNLGEMITKVDQALKKKPDELKRVNAKDLFND